MKKTIALLVSILSLALVMALPVKAAEFDLVADGVEALTDDEYVELNELAMDITDQYQCEVSIVVMADMGNDDVNESAASFYEEHDYGYGTDKSGLMLFISMKERDFTLYAHGEGKTAFTDHGKDVLEVDYLSPLLGKDQYYDAFLSYLNQTAEFLEMAENGTPFDEALDEEDSTSSFWLKLAITILVPLVTAGVVTGIFLGQMKSAVPQRSADNFIPDGGVNLTMKADQFLFSTETRTKIEKQTSDGGSSNKSGGSSDSKGKF